MADLNHLYKEPEEYIKQFLIKHDFSSQLLTSSLAFAVKNSTLSVIQFLISSPELFHHANPCENENVLEEALKKEKWDIIDYLTSLKNPPKWSEKGHRELMIACESGKISIYDKVMDIYQDKKDSLLRSQNHQAISTVCEMGHFELFKHIMNTTDDDYHGNAYHRALPQSIKHNRLDIMEYLFNETSLKEHFDAVDINRAFIDACMFGKIQSVRFFMDCVHTRDKIDFSYRNYSCFEVAFEQGYQDILEFFILEHELHKLEDVQYTLATYKRREHPSYPMVDQMMIYKSLEVNLIHDKKTSVKNKI